MDLLITAWTRRFKASQHLQQIKECSEVRLLQEEQHGDVLLLRGRQTGGWELDTLALPLPAGGSKRNKHHLRKKCAKPCY